MMLIEQCVKIWIAFLLLSSLQIVQGVSWQSVASFDHKPNNVLTSGGVAICTNWKTVSCRLKPTKSYANNVSSLYFWYPTVPGSCNHKCGESKKLKGISCFDRNLSVVDNSNCLHLGTPETSQTCGNFACMTYKSHALPWSDCNKSCGRGHQTRKKLCIDNFGNIVNPSYCGIVNGIVETRSCIVQACNTSYWDASSWNACVGTCGGSKKARNVTCVRKGKPNDYCLKPELKEEELCNSQPCKDYSWLVGPWTACNHDRKRLVQDDACSCFDDWEGSNCEKPKSCNGFLGYSTHNTATCCKLVDHKQTCCRNLTAKLDKDGNCCESGILDACGICNGEAIAVDSHNKCCSSIRDEKGVCCKSGNVDECHVCDGDGSTCATVITLSLSANVNSSSLVSKDNLLTSLLIQKTVAYISLHIHASEDSLSVISIIVDNGALNVAKNHSNLVTGIGHLQHMNVTVGILLNSEAVEANVSSIQSVTRTGVCGNGVCEIGERCTWDGRSATTDSSSCCQDDCPYVASICPTKSANRKSICSGYGICFDTTGECICYEGHGSPDCSECVEGWIATADGFCVKLPDLQALRKLHLMYTSAHNFNTMVMPQKGSSMRTYLLLIILLVVLLAIIIGAIVCRRFTQAREKRVSIIYNHEDIVQLESKRNWRTSILGPFEDFDVIPVTSTGYKTMFDDSENHDNSSKLEAPTTIFNAYGDGNGRRASATEVLPMPYLIDYLSDSECESESSDEADLQNFMMMSYTA